MKTTYIMTISMIVLHTCLIADVTYTMKLWFDDRLLEENAYASSNLKASR
jgi:hypothetical protein